ncbi:MAG: ACP S-malonyltransferase [Holophagales bacterium]|nr:ACP S-malonyltransferase [Holophagales bacterium]
MNKVAWLFPGQGSQAVGMGQALAASGHHATEKALGAADSALGYSLSKIMAEGPEETLKLTEHTQPAILTHSIMALEFCRGRLPEPDFVAGHSLGEYSALVAAGSIDFEAAVVAVKARGRFMQEAVPFGTGDMVAVIGMAASDVEAACAAAAESTGKVVVPANYNGAGQIVIAGHLEAVEAAVEILKGKGGRKMMKLPVSAPFHSPLMEPAQKAMEPIIKSLEIKPPICPLINNVDAVPVTDPEVIRQGLIRQIPSPVRWEDTMKFLLSQGVTTYIGLGGKVLTTIAIKMAKEAGVEIKALSIGAPDDLEQLQN